VTPIAAVSAVRLSGLATTKGWPAKAIGFAGRFIGGALNDAMRLSWLHPVTRRNDVNLCFMHRLIGTLLCCTGQAKYCWQTARWIV